jgi:D-tyrosyl-tRNA(Tyr) deacylase
MRAVIQRASQGRVEVNGAVVGSIGRLGLVILLGIADGDTPEQVGPLADKIAQLRLFENEEGKLDQSLLDIQGPALVVSQFTLLADTRKGRRPSFSQAARPEVAEPMVEQFVEHLRSLGVEVETGLFGARMSVSLVNEGPVTLILESHA